MKATETKLKEGCVKCKERRDGQYIEAEISTLHYNRDCVCITFNYQDWCWSKKCLSFDNEVTIEIQMIEFLRWFDKKSMIDIKEELIKHINKEL